MEGCEELVARRSLVGTHLLEPDPRPRRQAGAGKEDEEPRQVEDAPEAPDLPREPCGPCAGRRLRLLLQGLLRGLLAIALREEPLAQPDRFGRDLDQFVVLDIL